MQKSECLSIWRKFICPGLVINSLNGEQGSTINYQQFVWWAVVGIPCVYTRCRFSWPTIHRTKGLGTGREQVMTSVAAELRELRPLLRFACPRQREKGILKVLIPERGYGKKRNGIRKTIGLRTRWCVQRMTCVFLEIRNRGHGQEKDTRKRQRKMCGCSRRYWEPLAYL